MLDIRLPEGIEPFRLTRKRWTYRAFGGGGRPMRFIDSIEPAGEEDTICIQVAAADSLYVTDDFLVTHNTLNDAFIILDEAQNTTPEQMKMFLTRIGFGSKAVVNGDSTQTDLQSGQASGLGVVQEILEGHRGHRVLSPRCPGRGSPQDRARHRGGVPSLRRTARRGGRRTSVTAMSDDDGSHPAVLISNRQSMSVDEEGLTALARQTLGAEGLTSQVELSVSFVDEAEMTDLHVRYMEEEGPTDVLSFPLDEVDDRGVRLLGDVIVAPSVAARNNPDDPAGEVRLLLVHGILHVLGYDHEDDAERAEMWARQERYSGVRVP